MNEPDDGKGTELLPPSKLIVLRNLSWLSLVALAVPFLAILMPGIATIRGWGDEVVAALINLSWVLVIFGGFAFLVVSLFSAAVLFRVFNMHDKAHSLGLPRNSIRSLLTFLIFLILMAFIFYSTQVASTQSSTGTATIPLTGAEDQLATLRETISVLGIADALTGYEVVTEGTKTFARLSFLIQEESAAMEYFDRILVALLGISSTIIGFYFGTRSREGLGEAGAGEAAEVEAQGAPPGAEEVAPETADESDSLDWSLVSRKLTLAPAPGGGALTGIVMVTPSDPEGSRPFGARFVPTEKHEPEVDAAEIEVTRVADRLTLTVTGIDPAMIRDLGLEMSVFYRDEEEQAKTLPVEVEGI